MDGHTLAVKFRDFNRVYFRGKLPAYHIRVVGRITSLGEAGYCNRERTVIRIQSGLGDVQSISTLLHEMAHAATTDGHGMSWKREMIRLREAGAPLSPPDSDVSLDDWSGLRVTKAHFERVLEEVLVELPRATMHQVIRWFIRSQGGEATVAEFTRKYPWVHSVFMQCKRERERRLAQRARLMALMETKRGEAPSQ